MKACVKETLLKLQAILVVASCSCEILTVTPGDAVAPLGSVVTLNCSAEDTSSIVSWSILIPGGFEARSSRNPLPLDIIAEDMMGFSRLRITATPNYDGSAIRCVTFVGAEPCLTEPAITTVFYGPPIAPTNLTATGNGIGSIIISWSLASIEGVDLEFHLVVTNVNDPASQLVLTTGNQHYVVTAPANSACDLYSFRVIARNAAGNSTSDSIITSFPPSPPDISPIEDSLRYSAIRTENQVVLNVTFNRATSCPDYPVRNYTLVLDNLLGDDPTMILLAEIDGRVTVETPLEENSRYSFHVVVANDVGEVNSTSNTLNIAVEITSPTNVTPRLPSVTPRPNACSSTTIALTSTVSVIITALLAAVIFVLVQIAVCKFHPQFKPRGAETATVTGEEGQEYEQVDGGEGGVGVSDPTYMEVGAGGGNTFQLKENEAYISRVDL